MSEKQFNTVLEIYNRELDKESNQLNQVLPSLADLDITLSKFDLAKKYMNISLSIVTNSNILSMPSYGAILNMDAYVNYCLGNLKTSDTLYKKVIKNDEEYNLNKKVTQHYN